MSDILELKGTAISKSEIKTFGSGFQKQELVIMTDEQFPQPVMIEFTSSNIDLLKGIRKDDYLKVGINIRGREWVSPQGETKYFNSIVAWRLDVISSGGSTPTPAPSIPEPKPVEQSDVFAEDEDDDLPF